ncbi:hypothetical protein [Mycobacterium phage WXIN]|nr:hypothetical protein [Mycobacterium phage WXIN]
MTMAIALILISITPVMLVAIAGVGYVNHNN